MPVPCVRYLFAVILDVEVINLLLLFTREINFAEYRDTAGITELVYFSTPHPCDMNNVSCVKQSAFE